MHWQKNTVEFSRIIGENKFEIMFGGLHVEMACMKTMEDWLEGSGWTALLTEANIASFGTADFFLKAAHISDTSYAHEVTLVVCIISCKRRTQSTLKNCQKVIRLLATTPGKSRELRKVQCFTIGQYLSNTSSHF